MEAALRRAYDPLRNGLVNIGYGHGTKSLVEGRMMQKGFALVTTGLVALMLAAAGSAFVASAEPEATRELRLYNWDEYVSPQVLEDFEAEFGILVTVETFSDEDEMVSVVQGDTSRFDILVASDEVVHQLIEQRLLSELRHENVPNLANADPRFLDLPSDSGNVYSAPYAWGTTGITYDTGCVEPSEESWGLLLDPSIAGRVAMDIDFDVALASILKYLGYPLNSRDPEEVAAATSVLGSLINDQGLEFLPWDEILDRLASGDLCAGQTYNGDAVVYLEDNEQLAFFVPKEGSDFFVDSLTITRDSPEPAWRRSVHQLHPPPGCPCRKQRIYGVCGS